MDKHSINYTAKYNAEITLFKYKARIRLIIIFKKQIIKCLKIKIALLRYAETAFVKCDINCTVSVRQKLHFLNKCKQHCLKIKQIFHCL